jgi:CBS-domain-containing membrane protein
VAGLAISNIIAVKLFALAPLALPTALILFLATRINRRRERAFPHRQNQLLRSNDNAKR